MKDKITVDISGLVYYSPLDQEIFFWGLNRIPAVTIVDYRTLCVEPKKFKTPIQRLNFKGILKRYRYNSELLDKIMTDIPEIKPKIPKKYRNMKYEFENQE